MSGARVLVVEDEAALVRILRRTLERKFSVEVDSAPDGQQGLACATDTPYDLILSDIRMPQMDGISMLERIREGGGPNRSTPVVLLTGHHEEGKAAAEALDARFMGKPFKRQALFEMVRELLAAS